MRVLFDILGSTALSGGMRLHSTELLRAWCEQFPSDEVSVVAGAWAKDDFASLPMRVIYWPNESVLGRATGQLLVTPLAGMFGRVDYVVSLSPIVSPLVPSPRAVCFQHDWRHKKNPDEFPVHQRAYRRLWERSAAHALVNVCISEKAATETQKYVEGSKTVVIENGRDHARRWPATSSQSARRHITTFGHHNNKRPELVIRGLAEAGTGLTDVALVVLGARGSYAEDLSALAASLGLRDRVSFPGFVEDSDYQMFVSTASAIVLASSDEGFGLPIAEAEFFGIPAVVTSDSGMAEIFGDFAIVAQPSAERIAEALVKAMNSERSARGAGTQPSSWLQTAGRLRAFLATQAPADPRGRR